MLLDSRGNCKLTHFSGSLDYIEKSGPRYDRTGVMENTINGDYLPDEEYSAPEILISYLDVEHSIDFWRLGVMTYKMLTGRYPFSDLNSQLIAKLELESLKISTEAKQFISESLHKDKFDRLGSQQSNKKVKEHPFFKGIDWLQLDKGLLETPFKPKIVNISYSTEKNKPIIFLFRT